jgi:hypothetical protein
MCSLDPQLDPHTVSPVSPPSVAAEGRPIVGANPFRQTILAKGGFKDRFGMGKIGCPNCLAPQ